MADRDEMSYGIKSTLPVVRCDAVYRGEFDWTADGDGRYTAASDIAKNFVSHLCAASGHDQPVDAMVPEAKQWASAGARNLWQGAGDLLEGRLLLRGF
jgi:hypothetical protein